MRKQHILFDLDGTIVDSSQGIFSSINYALRKLEREELPLDILKTFVGPPLKDSFIRIGLDEQTADLAVNYYRKLYKKEAVYQVKTYEGIEETLAELAKTKKIFLATSKPEFFAKIILEHLAFTSYFTGIYGADLEGTRTAKADVIHYALTKENITERETVVMIGDRKHDILGAADNGLESIGVLYGFGSKEELTHAGATHLVSTAKELITLID